MPHRVAFVIDEGVCTGQRDLLEQIDAYCRTRAETTQNVTAPMVFPGGEVLKNSSHYVNLIQKAVNTHAICRHSFVIAIGGGALRAIPV
jgi:3-dehydroquinate synthase